MSNFVEFVDVDENLHCFNVNHISHFCELVDLTEVYLLENSRYFKICESYEQVKQKIDKAVMDTTHIENLQDLVVAQSKLIELLQGKSSLVSLDDIEKEYK